MVLLAHQDTTTTFSKFSGQKTYYKLSEQDNNPTETSLDSSRSRRQHHDKVTVHSRLSSGRTNDTTTAATSELDEKAHIVSGPLLPIRQARRGVHPNRSYRVVGTHQSMLGSVEFSEFHTMDVAPVVVTPPTPISVSVSTGSYFSRTNREDSPPGPDSGDSRNSSKSTVRAEPGSSNLVGVNGREEAPMTLGDSRQSSIDCAAAEQKLGHGAKNHQHHHRPSNASKPQNGADIEGRSGGGAVQVRSLLPGPRTSPILIQSRRSGYVSNNSISPQGSLANLNNSSLDLDLAAQQYLVQRIPNRHVSEQQRLSSDRHSNNGNPAAATRSSSQICIASPRARLQEQQSLLNSRSNLQVDGSGSLANETNSKAYFADSEMDRGQNHMEQQPLADNTNLDASNSWNHSSGEEAPVLTERQRRRQAIPTEITTERFHVRPITIVSPSREQDDDPLVSSPLNNSVITATHSIVSPVSALLTTSSDEHEDGHESNMPATHSNNYRATSFDLGRIGGPTIYGTVAHPSEDDDIGYNSLPPMAKKLSFNSTSHATQTAKAPLHRPRSSVRISTRKVPPPAVNISTIEKIEDGYEGDSEALLRPSMAEVPMHRRNTVAGEKMNNLFVATAHSRSGISRLMRNTSDLTNLPAMKDERRGTIRNSRRRSTAYQNLPIGTQIAPGHANYVLMYNMLTGIRVSVSRCEAKDSRPVRPEDYLAMHKYSFDVVGDEMTPSSRYDFKFKDYAPWVFRCIREAFHLSTEEYLVSLTDKYILSEVGSSGKSGSFFYYSQDYRFIIKTVHHAEHKFMRRILSQYYEFVRDNPSTLLSRIYGLHRIKLPQGRKVHFIVMSNILPPNKDIHAQFDLKGSMLGRELSPEQAARPRACLKDKNWVKMDERLHLGPTKRREFVKQLIEDVTLLIRLNIMDYSLLVGIHDLHKGNVAKLRDTTLAMFDPQTTDIQQLNRLTRAHTIRKKVVHTDPVALDALPQGKAPLLPESMFQELRYSIFYREDGGVRSTDQNDHPAGLIYYLGVIDILTLYSTFKRTEHVVKSMVHDSKQISAVNPRKYGIRFLRFIIHSLEGSEDVLPLLEEFENTTYEDICREHRLF